MLKLTTEENHNFVKWERNYNVPKSIRICWQIIYHCFAIIEKIKLSIYIYSGAHHFNSICTIYPIKKIQKPMMIQTYIIHTPIKSKEIERQNTSMYKCPQKQAL